MGRFKNLTTEEFVRNARLVHNNEYDYSKVIYVDSKSPVCIICPKHGEFWQRPNDHLNGHGCKKCGIEKRNKHNTQTLEKFILKAKEVHKDRFDYSLVDYTNSKKDVCIICNECGTQFLQTPNQHLQGRGCPHCGKHHRNDKTRGVARPVIKESPFGVGINDYEFSTSHLVSYHRWINMLQRCYDKKYHKQKPTYKECSVCDEWLYFSNFKKWFDENYIDGYALDKDILVKGNKIYSPNTCCFLPQEINSALVFHRNKEGEMPLGVCFLKDSNVYLGIGKNGSLKRFKTAEEAHNHYVKYKTKRIKELAEKYKDVITERVYNALLNYELPEDLTPDGVQMKAM